MGPGTHPLQPTVIDVHIADSPGGAGLRAPGVTATEVALDNLSSGLVIVDGSEWTGDGAYLATHTGIFQHFFGTRGGVNDNGFDRAGM